MAQLHRSAVSLRISGDTLVPEQISTLLGGAPTWAHAKGDTIQRSSRATPRTAKTGTWHLDAEDRQPEDMNGQIAEILGQLTQDLEIWRSIAKTYRMDLFCGWFMEENGEGLSISPISLAALAERGIELGICLYPPTVE